MDEASNIGGEAASPEKDDDTKTIEKATATMEVSGATTAESADGEEAGEEDEQAPADELAEAEAKNNRSEPSAAEDTPMKQKKKSSLFGVGLSASTFDIFNASADSTPPAKTKKKGRRLLKGLKKRMQRLARPSQVNSGLLSASAAAALGSSLSLSSSTSSASGMYLVARGFLELSTVTEPGKQVRWLSVCGPHFAFGSGERRIAKVIRELLTVRSFYCPVIPNGQPTESQAAFFHGQCRQRLCTDRCQHHPHAKSLGPTGGPAAPSQSYSKTFLSRAMPTYGSGKLDGVR